MLFDTGGNKDIYLNLHYPESPMAHTVYKCVGFTKMVDG